MSRRGCSEDSEARQTLLSSSESEPEEVDSDGGIRFIVSMIISQPQDAPRFAVDCCWFLAGLTSLDTPRLNSGDI